MESKLIKTTEKAPVIPHLSLWDSVSIIVGIVIGAGIYETAPLIFATVSGPWMAMGVWALGGLLSLAGALCYAELASTYPRSGGDYVYLSLAYGRPVGFLFGWAQLTVIFTGSIGMMAYIFADYTAVLFGSGEEGTYLHAALAVIALTAVNIAGVTLGKHAQNAFTLAKVFGLLFIFLAGIWALSGQAQTIALPALSAEANEFSWGSLGLALVFVLYTYGGWNDAAFVTAELRNRRQIPVALVLGTTLIAAIYLATNLAYLAGLGLERAARSHAIAADLLQRPLGSLGSTAMSLLVMTSALGAVNGLIFTGSRLYAEVGKEHRVFARLSRWNWQWGTPVASLVAQATVTIALIVLVGSPAGRLAVSKAVLAVGLPEPAWKGHGGFDTLLRCTAPVFWLFFLLTGLSLFILRRKDPMAARPFSVPLFPAVPLVFCGTSAFMLYRSAEYAGSLAFVGGALLFTGLPVYLFSARRNSAGNHS